MKKTTNCQTINMLLTGQYSGSQLGSFMIGQDFGLKKTDIVRGLRIAHNIEELTATPDNTSGAVLIPFAELKKIAFNLFDSNKNEMTINNLPAAALVIVGSEQIRRSFYCEFNQAIDWSQSIINICSPLTALPAGQYYSLPIQVYF